MIAFHEGDLVTYVGEGPSRLEGHVGRVVDASRDFDIVVDWPALDTRTTVYPKSLKVIEQ